MNLFNFIGDIFTKVTDLIDEVTTTDEEKDKVRIKIQHLQATQMQEMLRYQQKLLHAQSTIIKAEALGASFLQRNWRPITMITFLFLVVCDSFGLLTFRLASEAWSLLQIGLGGYVIGRTAEKITPKIIDKIGK